MTDNPFQDPTFLRTLDQFRNTQETANIRQLLEEQNRLQREANELKKKELGQRQKDEQVGTCVCPACQGSGKGYMHITTCYHCGGTGRMRLEDTCACPECGGKGTVDHLYPPANKCIHCWGTGRKSLKK